MKIAVTYENGEIFQHFGHTETFKIYDVTDGKITGTQIVDTNGNGHGALAGFLVENGVDTLICGGIGGGAQNALAQARQLLGFDKPEDGPAAFVHAVLASRADTAMIPMQDVLGLGGWARMNRPGTIGNNWLWRMAPGAATPELAQRLRRENEATNRRMD